jgi:NADP-dependent 3-hydroxy acid dehydrogenase YdfG
MGSKESVLAAIETVTKMGVRVDILVNSAGTVSRSLASEIPLEEFTNVMDINFSK